MRDKRVFRSFTMVTQISISMMVPIFLCIFIGYKLDEKFESSYWFLIFMLLGFITAFRNVYHLTKGFYAKEKAKEDAKMNYFANLRQNKEEQEDGKKNSR